MDEYIDRRILANIRIPPAHYIRSDYNTAYQQGCEDMLALVKSITPAADVRKNVRGEWSVNSPIVRCSSCGYFDGVDEIPIYTGGELILPKFCPNCGADMRGGDAQ